MMSVILKILSYAAAVWFGFLLCSLASIGKERVGMKYRFDRKTEK